jgi:hypothetical protein
MELEVDGYKYARWRDNFDGRIREIWRSEKELGRTASSKVRSASPETGTAWAEDQIRQGRVDCEKVMSQLDRTRLPKGYLEKIEGLEAPAAVKSLLRDTRNHGVAFRESGADRNLGSPVDSYFLKVFAKNATVPEHNLVVEAGPIPQADRIVQGFDFVLNKISRSAKAPKSHGEAFERTRLLLEDEKGLNELRYWASTFDHFALAEFDSPLETTLSRELVRQLEKATPYRSMLDYFKPHSVGGLGTHWFRAHFGFGTPYRCNQSAYRARGWNLQMVWLAGRRLPRTSVAILCCRR